MLHQNQKIKLVLINLWSLPTNTPHFGLLSLAAFIRKNLTDVEIKIIEGKNLFNQILSEKPNLIGFTSDTLTFTKTCDLACNLRKKTDVPFIIGGVHITAMPQSFTRPFDLAVLGEGEITLLELLKIFSQHKKFLAYDLKKVNGIIFKQGNEVVTTQRRGLIKDIDELPYPARDLVPMEEFYLKNQLNLFNIKRLISMMTSRGCAYKCVFCGSPVQWNCVRWHSPEYIINEIKLLIDKYKIDGLMFWDDLFVAPRYRLIELVKLIQQQGLHKKLVFFGYARANLIDKEVCRLLKSINTKRLIFGFESGSEKILAYLKKNTVRLEDNLRTIELCRKYGITISSGFIVGSPNETLEDLQKTYEFIKSYPLDNTQIYVLTPYPGTKLWQIAEENDRVLSKMDFSKLYVQLPTPKLIDYLKTTKHGLLKNRIFLNPEFENNKKYLDLIFKIIKLAYVQNIFFYFKIMPKNLGLIKRIILLNIRKIFNQQTGPRFIKI